MVRALTAAKVLTICRHKYCMADIFFVNLNSIIFKVTETHYLKEILIIKLQKLKKVWGYRNMGKWFGDDELHWSKKDQS